MDFQVVTQKLQPKWKVPAMDSLGAYLSRYRSEIELIRVRAFDLNGRRGGIDKLITAKVRLRNRGYLFIKAEGSTWLEALSKIKARLRRSLQKSLEARRIRHKSRMEFSEELLS